MPARAVHVSDFGPREADRHVRAQPWRLSRPQRIVVPAGRLRPHEEGAALVQRTILDRSRGRRVHGHAGGQRLPRQNAARSRRIRRPDALSASHLQRAKERLSTFALAAALSSEDRNTSTLTAQALGWEGALRNERCGFWASTHSYVQQAREPLLHGAWAATIAEHNKLDLELYRWLREAPVVRGQRHSEARSRN